MNLIEAKVTNPENETSYPYSTPLYQKGFKIQFAPVTIIVGENGVGKSTLLESIAQKLEFPLTGGNFNNKNVYNDLSFVLNQYNQNVIQTIREAYESNIDTNDCFDNTSLSDNIQLVWRIKNHKGVFLRSETFGTMINLPRFQSAKELSHGEGIINIINTINDDGVYILDEPDAGLSPLKTIELMSSIINKSTNNKAQFILSTHSPILMLLPNAKIYNMTDEKIEEVAPKDTTHFKITKQITNNPQDFINKYFE